MLKEFIDFELDGIDHRDYPDFVDAYICNAKVKLHNGEIREATDAEIEKLNQDSGLIYELVIGQIF
jgi:hypothetical protein